MGIGKFEEKITEDAAQGVNKRRPNTGKERGAENSSL